MTTKSDNVSSNIHSGEDARSDIAFGVSQVVNVIKSSYGPYGSNTIVEIDAYPNHRVTNDGKIIAESIKLTHPVGNIGADLVKEAADKCDRESGDGRKTAMILLDAILFEGTKSRSSPQEIRKSLSECLPIVIDHLNWQTVSINLNEVGDIARVASENEMLGSVFQEIYTKIGKDGIVEIDTSGTGETYYETTVGVKLLGAKYMYPYMANDARKKTATFVSPSILITKQKISNIFELDKILKKVSETGKNELVIFCDEIEMQVSQALSYLHHGVTPDGRQIAPFRTLVIKSPALWKDWLFEDFAKITGAEIVDPAQGRTLKNFQMNWLGSAGKVVTTDENTVVLGIKDIKDHIEYLKGLGDDDSKIRVARLTTKTAILYVGAGSESELSYLKGKATDARNSSYLALNHGVVLGGGISLLKVVQKGLPDTLGGRILTQALVSPLFTLMKNRGSEYNENDMQVGKIYDSVLVVKNSVSNAISVASTILSTDTVITKPKS